MSTSRLARLARPATRLSTLTPSIRAAAPLGARAFSQSLARRGGDSHHYDPPTGWLFGVKPGEEYKKEGWETATFYVFIPLMVLFVGVYAFKPDTRYVELCEGSGGLFHWELEVLLGTVEGRIWRKGQRERNSVLEC